MKPYSVMLKYPDAEGDDCTWYGFVEADTPAEAVRVAQRCCMDDNTYGGDGEDEVCWIDDPEELSVLLVIDGHHRSYL
jgi:hypothetical protein